MAHRWYYVPSNHPPTDGQNTRPIFYLSSCFKYRSLLRSLKSRRHLDPVLCHRPDQREREWEPLLPSCSASPSLAACQVKPNAELSSPSLPPAIFWWLGTCKTGSSHPLRNPCMVKALCYLRNAPRNDDNRPVITSISRKRWIWIDIDLHTVRADSWFWRVLGQVGRLDPLIFFYR
jgi:hypothetical protein